MFSTRILTAALTATAVLASTADATDKTKAGATILTDAAPPDLQLMMIDGKNAGPIVDTSLGLPAGTYPGARGCSGIIDPVELSNADATAVFTDFTDPGVQDASYFYASNFDNEPKRFEVRARDGSGIVRIKASIVTRKLWTEPGVGSTYLSQPVEYLNVNQANAMSYVAPVYNNTSTGVTYLHDETVLSWDVASSARPLGWRSMTFEIQGLLGLTSNVRVEAVDGHGNVVSDSSYFLPDEVCQSYRRKSFNRTTGAFGDRAAPTIRVRTAASTETQDIKLDQTDHNIPGRAVEAFLSDIEKGGDSYNAADDLGDVMATVFGSKHVARDTDSFVPSCAVHQVTLNAFPPLFSDPAASEPIICSEIELI